MTTIRHQPVNADSAVKRIRVTRGQVTAAQALVKLRTERGEAVDPAPQALADATPVRVAKHSD